MDVSQAAVLGKKLVFVTGKGGIGKTAVTGALGAWSAGSGQKTLMVESSHRDQLAPLFGRDPVGHTEISIAPHLSCINLSPAENFREYVTKYLGQKRLYDTVFSNRVVKSFINTIPGFGEIMMLGRLFYSCELAPAPRDDLVLFDGYASGHFLSLMTTPDAVLATKLGGPLVKETERVKAFLRDSTKVGILYVLTPEPLVVAEALDFLPRLHRESPASLMGVVINRSWQGLAPMIDAPPVVDDFLKTRRLRAAEAMEEFDRQWQTLPAEISSLPVIHLRDYGSIAEPMTVQLAREWLEPAFAKHPDLRRQLVREGL